MIKNRIELAEEFAKRGYKRGAEIGTADGRYAEILCQKNPELVLYAVDPWYPYEGNWRSESYQNRAFEMAQKRLQPYNAFMMRKTSLEASLEVKNEALDFVFIDGSHTFDNVMLDILLWTPKVRKGGIVSGHDYYQFNDSGVIEAVNAYVEKHKIDLQLTLRDLSGHKDDRCPCWWFEKK